MPRGIRVFAPILLLSGIGAWGCKSLVGFGVVSISPIYGYADGCTPVRVSGHGFQERINVRVGGAPATAVTWPSEALDQGFTVTAITPPGTPGLANVQVTVDGETSVIENGFFYEACPLPVNIEAWDQSDEVLAEGSVITLAGCNLSATYTIRIGDNGQQWGDTPDNSPLADIPITSICSSAEASFTIPSGIADGEYLMGFFDGAGNQVWPDPACNIRTIPGSYPLDTGDSADFDPCAGAPTITIGEPEED